MDIGINSDPNSSTQSYKDAMGPLVRECMGSVSATEDDFKTVLNRNPLESRTAQCLLACALDKVGLISPEGAIYTGDDLMPVMNRLYGFNDFKTVMKAKAVNDCANQVNGAYPDRCDLIKNFTDCVRNSY
uniref:pheromone binding protein n=1 Tax=Rhyparobia maderae TaxID=36963 RepID=UPI00001B6583|nr:Chain A, pheromone binding protein [Rhyparobia maderae]1OW4_B Chain B, pheromone binding protein [Rhyparobia maderae]1P28_A Chain A, pheromone binding protein [Rhyparobia maderae]1P28_B Chain B, pheromone binding protein [Rhyparobia maderae]